MKHKEYWDNLFKEIDNLILQLNRSDLDEVSRNIKLKEFLIVNFIDKRQHKIKCAKEFKRGREFERNKKINM
jgi:hypothetical protein